MVLGTQPETGEVYFYRQSYEQHTQTVRMYNKYTEILLAIEQMEEALPHSLRACVCVCVCSCVNLVTQREVLPAR